MVDACVAADINIISDTLFCPEKRHLAAIFYPFFSSTFNNKTLKLMGTSDMFSLTS